MIRHFKLLSISTFCAIALWLSLTANATATKSCNQSYTVQAGDTLLAIAARQHVALSELMRINNIYNPNLIGINQQLCLRESLSVSQLPLQALRTKVALEAEFSVSQSMTESIYRLPQKEKIGLRSEFPLDANLPVMLTNTITILTDRLATSPVPLFWVAKIAGEDDVIRQLLVVPDPSKLASSMGLPDKVGMQMSELVGESACTGIPIGTPTSNALLDERLRSLTLWIESANGTRYPFAIEGITVADFAAVQADCFDMQPQLALFPSGDEADSYLLQWIIPLDLPPGPPSGYFVCEELFRGGIISQTLAYVQGCVPETDE